MSITHVRVSTECAGKRIFTAWIYPASKTLWWSISHLYTVYIFVSIFFDFAKEQTSLKQQCKVVGCVWSWLRGSTWPAGLWWSALEVRGDWRTWVWEEAPSSRCGEPVWCWGPRPNSNSPPLFSHQSTPTLHTPYKSTGERDDTRSLSDKPEVSENVKQDKCRTVNSTHNAYVRL